MTDDVGLLVVLIVIAAAIAIVMTLRARGLRHEVDGQRETERKMTRVLEHYEAARCAYERGDMASYDIEVEAARRKSAEISE